MRQVLSLTMVLILCSNSIQTVAAGGPKRFTHRITGLFTPDREQDLREVLAELPAIKLIDVDFKNAEATFEYDPAKLWPGEKPEKYLDRFDQQLRNASRGSFGARPLRTIPLDQLTRIEIPVVGLDCKGCSFAAYLMIHALPGVEVATASFKTGEVTALIDPKKTNRAEVEAALKKGGVRIASQE